MGPDAIVALAIGLPSLLVATLALWVAYLTLRHTRRLERSVSWPELGPICWVSNPSYELPAPPSVVRSRPRAEVARISWPH